MHDRALQAGRHLRKNLIKLRETAIETSRLFFACQYHYLGPYVVLKIFYRKFQDKSNAHSGYHTGPPSSASNFHLKFVSGSLRRHFELDFNDFGINLIVWSRTIHLLC